MFSAGRSAPVQKSPSVDSCISHLQINCAVDTAKEPPVIQPQCRCHEWVCKGVHTQGVVVLAAQWGSGWDIPFSLAASLHTLSITWMCTALLPQAAHTYISSLHLREHLFIHSYAHFDNQCRRFQHRGYIINPRYLKYFWFFAAEFPWNVTSWLSRTLTYYLMWNSSPEISYHLTNDSELIYWGNGDP